MALMRDALGWLALSTCLLVGCGDSTTEDAGGIGMDAGRADGGAREDAGSILDAGRRDGGRSDASSLDAGGPPDASMDASITFDASTNDAGETDAGPAMDGGASSADAGDGSAGSSDAGTFFDGCVRLANDPASIGMSCSPVGAACPAGYSCVGFSGIIVTYSCQIPCTYDCECPATTACVPVTDKSGVHYQCG